MSLSLESLKGNLQTLYAAAHSLEDEPPLIADWSETQLLFKDTGPISWLSSKVYDASQWVCSENLKRDKIQATLTLIRSSFSKEQQLAIDSKLDYETSLLKLIRHEIVPVKKFKAASNRITAFHLATATWTKFLKTKASERIKIWLNTFSDKAEGGAPFFSDNLLNDSAMLRHFYKFVLVNMYIKPSFVPLLFKSALSQPLDAYEIKHLQTLSNKINQCSSSLRVRDFTKALVVLNALFQKENPVASLVAMKLDLISEGCEIFFQKDLAHIEWRNRLKSGSQISWKKKKWTLGCQLGAKEDQSKDQNLIFTVLEDSSIVFSFGINRALHDIKIERRKNFCWGLKSVKYLEIEEKGRFGIVRKLSNPVIGIEWKSKKELDPEDEEIATPIANLLDFFLSKNKMFKDFSPHDIMFNEKGRLTYLKMPTEDALDFFKFICFIHNCAQGNHFIYKFFYNKIKFHPYIRVYKEVVWNTLEEFPNIISDLNIIFKNPHLRRTFANVEFPEIIIHELPDLQRRIFNIKNRCLELEKIMLKKKRVDCGRRYHQSLIDDKIFDIYDFYAFNLPDDFEEQVIENINMIFSEYPDRKEKSPSKLFEFLGLEESY